MAADWDMVKPDSSINDLGFNAPGTVLEKLLLVRETPI